MYLFARLDFYTLHDRQRRFELCPNIGTKVCTSNENIRTKGTYPQWLRRQCLQRLRGSGLPAILGFGLHLAFRLPTL
jgi:hypothetical protein